MVRKVLAFPLTRLLLVFVGFGALVALAQRIGGGAFHSPLGIELVLLVSLFVIVLIVEKHCVGVLFRFQDATPDLGKGFVLGGLMFAAVIGVLVLTRCYGGVFQTWNGLPVAAAFFLAVALFEELLFRGVLFRLLEEMTGTWIALAISAAIFGLLHVFNPGATAASSVAIALEAGVLLALAYALTRTLWFAIGIHWAWNLFEGPVFGAQVSGSTAKATLLHATLDGPAWLTGGKFGPEAGVVAVLVCLAVAIPIAREMMRRGNVMPPMWQRSITQP